MAPEVLPSDQIAASEVKAVTTPVDAPPQVRRRASSSWRETVLFSNCASVKHLFLHAAAPAGVHSGRTERYEQGIVSQKTRHRSLCCKRVCVGQAWPRPRTLWAASDVCPAPPQPLGVAPLQAQATAPAEEGPLSHQISKVRRVKPHPPRLSQPNDVNPASCIAGRVIPQPEALIPRVPRSTQS